MKKVFHIETEGEVGTLKRCNVSLYLINLCLGRGLFDFMAEQDRINLLPYTPALLTYHSLSSCLSWFWGTQQEKIISTASANEAS